MLWKGEANQRMCFQQKRKEKSTRADLHNLSDLYQICSLHPCGRWENHRVLVKTIFVKKYSREHTNVYKILENKVKISQVKASQAKPRQDKQVKSI